VGPSSPSGIVVENSINVTFSGDSRVPCGRCGRPAQIINGTYDFVGDVVRMVRSADLSLAEVVDLQRAVKAARSGDDPEAFAAEHPNLAPVVQQIILQAPGRDWVTMLVMVLAIVIPYLQARAYHQDEVRARDAPHAQPVTTTSLTDEEIAKIAARLEQRLDHRVKPPVPATPRDAQRKKRPGKTYGKTKRRGR
jgi:hypothetical protein